VAFGLRLSSEIDLPELRPTADPGKPDVRIEKGRLTGSGWDRIVSVDKARFRLALPDVGRFEVTDGSRIVADPDPSASSSQVRAYLLGSVIGALLHQRGVLTLHASAVDLGGEAVALMGESGAGKSTLAMALNRRGNVLLCDDLCVIRFGDDGQPMVWPGITRLKLWSQTLNAVGSSTQGLEPVLQKEDKYHLPADRVAEHRPVPLKAVYLIDKSGGSQELRRLRGAEAVNALMSHTYRGRMVPFLDKAAVHFASCLQLLSGAGVYELPRWWALDQLDQGASLIEEHLAGD